jgi:hypothetical protein
MLMTPVTIRFEGRVMLTIDCNLLYLELRDVCHISNASVRRKQSGNRSRNSGGTGH